MLDIGRGRPGFVIPTALVLVGAVLLAVNAGWLERSVWHAMVQFWPLLIIGVGVELLLGFRTSGGWLIAALVLLILAGGIAGYVGTEPVTQHPVMISMDDAETADLTLRAGVGRVDLGPGDDPEAALVGSVFAAPGDIEILESLADGHLTMEVRGQREGFQIRPPLWWENGSWRWELQLNPELPTALSVTAGVGEVELNLRELTLSHLEIRTGVGRMNVVIPAQGNFDARIDGGVGQMDVTIPESMAVRITARQGIGSLSITGVPRDGDIWESDGYAAAEHRVDLRINGGVGAISVHHE